MGTDISQNGTKASHQFDKLCRLLSNMKRLFRSEDFIDSNSCDTRLLILDEAELSGVTFFIIYTLQSMYEENNEKKLPFVNSKKNKEMKIGRQFRPNAVTEKDQNMAAEKMKVGRWKHRQAWEVDLGKRIIFLQGTHHMEIFILRRKNAGKGNNFDSLLSEAVIVVVGKTAAPNCVYQAVAHRKVSFIIVQGISDMKLTTYNEWLTFLLIMYCVCQCTAYPRHVCHPGTYLVTARNDLDFCLPCTDGVNFMPDSWHTHRNCYNCTQIRDQDLEILVTECTRTHDDQILCTPGYYRRTHRNAREQDKCVKCSECEHPTLAYQGYHDTVCCGAPNYDAVKNKDGVYVCQERPVLCDPGHFLNLNTRECSQCPPGTYITEDKHDNTACRPCLEDSDLRPDQVVVEIFNVTHQTVFGCRQGYFIDSSGEFSVARVKCLPCQKCKQQIRECDMYHNTVCCDDPGMQIVNVGSVTECRPRGHKQDSSNTLSDINLVSLEKTFCGEDQYLYTNQSNNLTMCLPCEKGTYVKERNHTMTFWKDYSDFQGVRVPKSCNNVTESTYRDGYNLQIGLSLGIIMPSLVLVVLIIVLVRRYQTRRQHREHTERIPKRRNNPGGVKEEASQESAPMNNDDTPEVSDEQPDLGYYSTDTAELTPVLQTKNNKVIVEEEEENQHTKQRYRIPKRRNNPGGVKEEASQESAPMNNDDTPEVNDEQPDLGYYSTDTAELTPVLQTKNNEVIVEEKAEHTQQLYKSSSL